MVYETRNHWLVENNKKIDITNLEHQLLVLLATNIKKLVTYEEIATKLYNTEVKYVMNSIRAIKRRLKEKTKIKIRTKKRKRLYARNNNLL